MAYSIDELNKISDYPTAACIGGVDASCCLSVNIRKSEYNRFRTAIETTE